MYKFSSESQYLNFLRLVIFFMLISNLCDRHGLTDDSALMRKGRLIAKYEFGKLSVTKSQALSNHFGNSTIITKPMTIAEIANQHEKDHQPQKVEVLGFRREFIQN